MKLHRYWFQFELTVHNPHPSGTVAGCGITALNYEDALKILQEHVFTQQKLPPICRVIEDVDIATLDPNHVRPNMGLPIKRGVWFPLGYD